LFIAFAAACGAWLAVLIRQMSKRFLFSAVSIAVAALVPVGANAELPQLELNAGIHVIRAEVANTFPTRGRGLMQRDFLEPNQGMLFVFDDVYRHCMWMKNTLIPLSVAFLDENGAIINIAEMAPQTEISHCATKPARFALEMNQGWFARRGLAAGTRIQGIERAPAPR
jgi:hypothetical protein